MKIGPSKLTPVREKEAQGQKKVRTLVRKSSKRRHNTSITFLSNTAKTKYFEDSKMESSKLVSKRR